MIREPSFQLGLMPFVVNYVDVSPKILQEERNRSLPGFDPGNQVLAATPLMATAARTAFTNLISALVRRCLEKRVKELIRRIR